ncbi:MAG: tetratricopeptide repeat protein, partial [Candidatus Heimdallarchaeota archaeon]
MKNRKKYKESLDLVTEFLKEEGLDQKSKYEAIKLKVKILLDAEQFEESLKSCITLLEYVQQNKENNQIAYVLLLKSEGLLLKNFYSTQKYDDYDKSIKDAEEFIEKEIDVDSSYYKELTGYLYYLKGIYFGLTDNDSKSIEYLELSLKLRKSIGNSEDICETCNELSTACFWNGEIERGIEIGNYGLKLLEEYDNPTIMVNTLFMLSMLHTVKGNHELALKIRKECSDLAKEHDFLFSYLGEGKITESWQLAFTGNWERALKLATEGLEYVKEKGSLWWTFFGYNFQGLIYYQTGQLDKALESALESLEIAKKINMVSLMSMAYRLIAFSYHRIGQLDNALEYYLKIFESFEVYKGPFYHSPILGGIIEVYAEKNNLEQAEKYLQIFKQIDEQTNLPMIRHRRLMAEAVVLMKSSIPRERGKAEVLLEQLGDIKEIEFYIKVKSLFYLCSLLLTELHLSGDIKIIEQLKKHLSKLLSIAESKQLYLLLVDIYILQSKIASIKMEIDEAKN